MRILLSSLVLGLAGFDIFGIAIALAAHAAKASKRAIVLFSFIVFIISVVGGVAASLFFGKSISLIADYFLQLPNSLWLGFKIILIIGLGIWLYKSLSADKNPTEKDAKSSRWLKKRTIRNGFAIFNLFIYRPIFYCTDCHCWSKRQCCTNRPCIQHLGFSEPNATFYTYDCYCNQLPRAFFKMV